MLTILLSTTIVDGQDLEIAPDNFSADPIKRSAVGKGISGQVHFLWPVAQRMKMLTLYYDAISKEQARRLVTALGPVTANNKLLEFSYDGDIYSAPGKIGVSVSFQDGYANVTVETVVRLLLDAATGPTNV